MAVILEITNLTLQIDPMHSACLPRPSTQRQARTGECRAAWWASCSRPVLSINHNSNGTMAVRWRCRGCRLVVVILWIKDNHMLQIILWLRIHRYSRINININNSSHLLEWEIYLILKSNWDCTAMTRSMIDQTCSRRHRGAWARRHKVDCSQIQPAD